MRLHALVSPGDCQGLAMRLHALVSPGDCQGLAMRLPALVSPATTRRYSAGNGSHAKLDTGHAKSDTTRIYTHLHAPTHTYTHLHAPTRTYTHLHAPTLIDSGGARAR